MDNFCHITKFPWQLLLSLAFYEYSAGRNMLSHDRCAKFKSSKYRSKGEEIRLGLGVT